EPSGDVVVLVATSDATEGAVVPSSLLFTTETWNTPQTVTITGQDDFLDDGNVSYSIVLTIDTDATEDPLYDAVNPADPSLLNIDDVTLGIVVTEAGGVTAVSETGETSDTYTVVLLSAPGENVAFAVSFDPD